MDKPDEVDWVKVAWMSAIAGGIPWALGLFARAAYKKAWDEQHRPRWKNEALFEKKGRDY